MNKFTNKFRSGKGEDIPGSEVREQYNAKINQFLHKVDEPGVRWFGLLDKPDVDLLEKLFAWGNKVWDERNTLQSRFSEAQMTISKLEADLLSTRRRLNEVETENESMKAKHQGELDNLKNRHTTVAKKEKDIHGREVRKLVGQLLVNQDDNMGWTDDKLKFRFQKLQTMVNTLVSPRNKEYRLPPNSQVTEDLDPTGFLTRTTKSKAHFLLQSTIWSILYEQFFSTPFGFGVLGRGTARKKLLDVYVPWAELLGKTAQQGTSGDQIFDFFRQSKVANTWRSATFQCINESLMEAPGSTDAPIATLIMENVDQTINRMTSVLLKVSRLSGSSRPGQLEELQQITYEARNLALQFGLHSARLQLNMPGRGELVQIGADVHDCEDGDCDIGSKCSVDLVTLPGLQKIGDGKADMSSKRTLVPCEIYPTS